MTYKLDNPLVRFCNKDELIKYLDEIKDITKEMTDKDDIFDEVESFDPEISKENIDILFWKPSNIFWALEFIQNNNTWLLDIVYASDMQEVAQVTIRWIAYTEFATWVAIHNVFGDF